jgi:hypothetical protein
MPSTGGKPYSGRSVDIKNKTTIERATAEKAALKALRARFSDKEFQNIGPLQILEEAMKRAFTAGDIRTAGQLAGLMAPDRHEKRRAALPETQCPADLMPDPT